MRIYSMTATFGKLEHAQLRLEPGLNIIHAPNEWGKSTWCAFLVAMLYGLDTRAKTTRNILADKDRYQPWSGSPMEGRIDLNWNGRDITIERRTKGRIPLGEFRAYETASGLDVPELNAANCGQQLLGEGQSVFRRAGFISLTDLPVTQDDALRRRLNALVTTGDESGDADRLSQGLRDLRNRCRYNKSGLLPQAEEELDALTETLREIEALESGLRKLRERRGDVLSRLRELENHAQSLAYSAATADAGRVAQARDSWQRELQRVESLDAECAALPSAETAAERIAQLRQLTGEWDQLQLELKLMPAEPQKQTVPQAFRDLDGRQAVAQARRDEEFYRSLSSKGWLFWVIAGILIAAAGGGLLVYADRIYGIAAVVAGIVLAVVGFARRGRQRAHADALEARYGSADPARWLESAETYAAQQRDYAYFAQRYQASRAEVEQKRARLESRKESLCGAQSPAQTLRLWEGTARRWEDLADARRDAAAAQNHYETLRSMVKTVERPAMADHLTYTHQETERFIRDARAELERLNSRAGQYRGRIESLGDPEVLRAQQEKLRQRIGKLEQTMEAVMLAQHTLSRASAELQRRFAPRITRRAQDLIGAMTGGRYDKLSLAEDLSIRAGAKQEDTMHSVRWRSAGTADQLYLALRLAVAEELMPQAPLVLDDVLARCDDERMRAVLDILKGMAQNRQIILFTCQNRETEG